MPTFNISIDSIQHSIWVPYTWLMVKKSRYNIPLSLPLSCTHCEIFLMKKRKKNIDKNTQCSTCHFQCERLTVTTGFSFYEIYLYAKRTHKVILENTEIVRNNLQLLVDRYDKQVLPNEFDSFRCFTVFFALSISPHSEAK